MPFPSSRRILICTRVGDPQLIAQPGSIETTCAGCGHAVTMSLESQVEKATGATPVACIECYAAYRDAGNPTVMRRQVPVWSRSR